MVFQRKLNIMRFHHDIIRIIVLLNLYLFSNCIYADVVDSLYMALKTRSQVQEKIYLQLDNTCYFKGDTIWYKAYTLRADNLKPTDMSRILYVELLTPDGYLVERQQLVIDYDGASNGMFILLIVFIPVIMSSVPIRNGISTLMLCKGNIPGRTENGFITSNLQGIITVISRDCIHGFFLSMRNLWIGIIRQNIS